MNSRQAFTVARLTLAIAILVAAHTLAAAQTTDGKANDSKTGAITGRVVNESGQPLANVSVSVSVPNSNQGRVTLSDKDGNFKVTGLDRATYFVSATAPAYVSRPRDPNDPFTNYYRVGDSVRLELIKGGVIGGTVTLPTGEPMVGINVRTIMVRDSVGQPLKYQSYSSEKTTDDRGIYRMYGLRPGTYVISAGGRGPLSFGTDPFDNAAPTFAPSSTRDGAAEFVIGPGGEVSNGDIRYRGEAGHTIRGVVNAPLSTISISYSQISNGRVIQTVTATQPVGGRGFALYGMPDGEYELTARSFVLPGETTLSDPVRVTVKDADVTGIELTTKPLASVSGRFELVASSAAECVGKEEFFFRETTVRVARNERNDQQEIALIEPYTTSLAWLDAKGEFLLRGLKPGEYRFETRLFAEYWYLKAISLSTQAPISTTKRGRSLRPATVNAARSWIPLKSGERRSGLTVTLAMGAASVRGKIKRAEGETIPLKLRVYLVPAEREVLGDPLRFFAVPVEKSDGTFTLGNLPPGKYWILARVAAENEPLPAKLRQPDGTDFRLKIRHEAESAKTEIQLKPCQNLAGYQLPLRQH